MVAEPAVPRPRRRARVGLAQELLAALLGLSVVPLAIAGVIAYGRLRTVIHDQAQATLQATAEGARATVREFLEYLKGRVLDVGSDWFIRDAVESAEGRPGPGGRLPELDRYLAVNRTSIPEAAEIFVLDAAGRVLASSDPGAVGRDAAGRRYFLAGRERLYLGEPVRRETGRLTWVAAAPLTSRRTGRFLGVLACRIEPRTLSELTTGRKATAFGVQSRSVRQGRTGEVYIVNHDHLMLTESRFVPGAVLAQRVDTEPVRRAFDRGEEMLGDYTDYRGIRITGASALIPDMRWVVVAEVDFDEALAPVRRLRAELLGLGLAVLPAVGLLGLLLQRSIVRPMRRIIEADERVMRGGPEEGLLPAEEMPGEEWARVVAMRNRMLTRVQQQSRALREEGEQQRRQSAILADLAERINASADPADVLQRVADAARSLLAADLAGLVLRVPGEGPPVFRHVSGPDADAYRGRPVGPDAEVAGRALATGRPGRSDDAAADRPRDPEAPGAAAEGTRSAVAVPLVIERRVEGVLYAHRRGPGAFGPGDEARLFALANQAGIAIQRARLIQQLEGRHARLERLVHASRGLSRIQSESWLRQRVAEAAGELLDSDRVRLHLVEHGVAGPVAAGIPADEAADGELPAGDAALAAAVRTGQAILLSDLGAEAAGAAGPSSAGDAYPDLLAVPLVVGDAVHAVLAVGRRTARMTPDDRAIATMFAAQAAIALDNARLYREAQEADRRKDQFLAMLAHELRNPLAPILNAVRVLQRLGAGDATAERLRGIVDRQARRLARLVDDLLDVARISYGKITLQLQPVDLNEVVRATTDSLHESGRDREHRIVVALAAEPLIVQGDPVRLEQVVGNLVDNAVKYSPAGAAIEIGVERAGAEAVCRVRDRGLGIAPELLGRIFEPLTQAHATLDRARGGLGLGLALVRALVELHHGSVHAASPGVGRGSEFVVRLPLLGQPRLPPRDEAAAVVGVPCHVLVVEDGADAREALRLLLECSGHRVEVAADGRRGIELALAGRPDVALVDIGLPGVDGYEVARRVRAEPAGKGIRLIALTGYGQPEDVRRALEAGFDAHLTKPVDPDALAAVLAGVPPPARPGVAGPRDAA